MSTWVIVVRYQWECPASQDILANARINGRASSLEKSGYERDGVITSRVLDPCSVAFFRNVAEYTLHEQI